MGVAKYICLTCDNRVIRSLLQRGIRFGASLEEFAFESPHVHLVAKLKKKNKLKLEGIPLSLSCRGKKIERKLCPKIRVHAGQIRELGNHHSSRERCATTNQEIIVATVSFWY